MGVAGTGMRYTLQETANENGVLGTSEPPEELNCGLFSYAVRASPAAISHLCNVVTSFDV